MDLPPEEKPNFYHFIKTPQNKFGTQHNKFLNSGLETVIPMEKFCFITSLRLSVLTQLIKQIKIYVHC